MCGNNQLTSLRSCPQNLKALSCSWNKLTSLRRCPKNLNALYCNGNQIKSLHYLPFSVTYLYCDHNPISLKYRNKTLEEIHYMNFNRKYEYDYHLFTKNTAYQADKKLNMLITILCI